jgi:hypothetical protein
VPFESAIVTAAIVVIYLLFAGALAYADHQTRRPRS